MDTEKLCSVSDSKSSVETSMRMGLPNSTNIKSFEARELQSLIVLVLFLAIAFTASASSQGIDFSFQTFNDSIIRRQGNATYDSKGFIQMTVADRGQNQYNSMGWATYREPMRLWDKVTRNVADFTTQFTFVFDSLGILGFGDGMTFFLAPNGSQIPDNSYGGSLAIIDPFHQLRPLVAVEYDAYYNNFHGVVVDPNCSLVAHIGIDLNNLNSKVSKCVDWFNDKIMSGGRINAKITYNSSMQNLSVLMVDADRMGTNINCSAIYYRVNLTEYLSEWVTFGFSASTGRRFELHIIEAWEFISIVQVAGNGTDISNGTDSL